MQWKLVYVFDSKPPPIVSKWSGSYPARFLLTYIFLCLPFQFIYYPDLCFLVFHGIAVSSATFSLCSLIHLCCFHEYPTLSPFLMFFLFICHWYFPFPLCGLGSFFPSPTCAFIILLLWLRFHFNANFKGKYCYSQMLHAHFYLNKRQTLLIRYLLFQIFPPCYDGFFLPLD